MPSLLVVVPRRSAQQVPDSRHSTRQGRVPLFGGKVQDVTQRLDGAVPVTHAEVRGREIDFDAIDL